MSIKSLVLASFLFAMTVNCSFGQLCFVPTTKSCDDLAPGNISCDGACMVLGQKCGDRFFSFGGSYDHVNLLPPDVYGGFDDFDTGAPGDEVACGVLVDCICYPNPLAPPVIGPPGLCSVNVLDFLVVPVIDFEDGVDFEIININGTILYGMPWTVTGDPCVDPDEEELDL